MEWWSNGGMEEFGNSAFSSLHYSITPLLHCCSPSSPLCAAPFSANFNRSWLIENSAV